MCYPRTDIESEDSVPSHQATAGRSRAFRQMDSHLINLSVNLHCGISKLWVLSERAQSAP